MTDQQFQIGDYVVEPLSGLVHAAEDGAQSTHLQPMVMSVLTYLVERQGEVVKRDELIEGVWGRPVTDDVLTRAIHELRVALNDQHAAHRYIETIPKIGYRLLTPVVTARFPNARDATTEGSENETAASLLSTLGVANRAAIGLAVVFALVAAYVFLTRDEPREDTEHYRVVLAAFENFTDDPRLERALGIAFRTGIEQSPQISIFPPATLALALERMRKDRNTPIDRVTAIEISLRENADTVIVGAIANAGDSYRLSGEIIEPQTGRTIFSHQSAVVDEDHILQALDKVVAAIRHGSGEAQSTIDENTVPLEKVTTANFEALEAYSIGMQKTGVGDLEGAIPFFREAIRLDASFAMAYAKLGFIQFVMSDVDPEATFNLDKALEFQERLTRKEQLYVSALIATFTTPGEMKNAWSLLIHSFPRYAEGYRILGNVYMVYDNDFEIAVEQLTKAVEIPDPMNAVAYQNLGFALLGLSRYEDALENVQKSWDDSRLPMGGGLGLAHISMKNYPAAEEFLRANMNYPSDVMRHLLKLMSAMSYLDQGKFEQAKSMAAQAETTAIGELGAQQRSVASRCAILEREDDTDDLLTCLRDLTELDMLDFEEGNIPRRYWPSASLAFIGIIAARNGQYDEARAVFDTIESHAGQSGIYPIESYASILKAELLMGEGQYEEAVRLLQGLVAERALFQAHESLARAYELAGDPTHAINEYVWLTENRGQAFAESVSRGFGNEFHILDWAVAHASLGRLYVEAGMPAEALAAYEVLLEHWANADDGIPVVDLSRRRAEALRAQLTRASQ